MYNIGISIFNNNNLLKMRVVRDVRCQYVHAIHKMKWNLFSNI